LLAANDAGNLVIKLILGFAGEAAEVAFEFVGGQGLVDHIGFLGRLGQGVAPTAFAAGGLIELSHTAAKQFFGFSDDGIAMGDGIAAILLDGLGEAFVDDGPVYSLRLRR
jgi:hypothetical protein